MGIKNRKRYRDRYEMRAMERNASMLHMDLGRARCVTFGVGLGDEPGSVVVRIGGRGEEKVSTFLTPRRARTLGRWLLHADVLQVRARLRGMWDADHDHVPLKPAAISPMHLI